MTGENNQTDRTDWHIALLGGLKRGGRFTLPSRTVVVTLVGGADLDLREATLTTPEVLVTKVSVVSTSPSRPVPA
jgi:hypothetical protein